MDSGRAVCAFPAEGGLICVIYHNILPAQTLNRWIQEEQDQSQNEIIPFAMVAA